MAGRATYDAIVVGGGHNGLVCACYLARTGLDVLVLERRHVLGGAAVTEEFAPGFRNSVASYTVSLLHPQIIADLRLHQHGLRIVERPVGNFLPLTDGGYLSFGGTATAQAPSAIPPCDRERLPAYFRMLDKVVDLLHGTLLTTPPNAGGGVIDLWRALRAARGWQRLGIEDQRQATRLLFRSAGEVLDEWFESAPLKALFGFDAIVGNLASPYHPGTGYVLLHHVFGEVNGKRGAWGHAIGGMGAITQAMAAEARGLTVALRTEAEVAEILIRDGRACGVRLADGNEIHARLVVSSLSPRLLFERLVPAHALPEGFRTAIAGYRCGSGSFRMNVALAELPDFTCLPGTKAAPHHSSGIIIGPSLEYMHRAYEDARRDGWSREPVVEMMIASTLDPTLAPPGRHVASLFCQHFLPELPGERGWDDCREEAAERVIDTVDRHAPNFRASIIGHSALSPLDLERDFGLVGGDIFHGRLSLEQLYSARPLLGYADYRTPVPGLYMCGAGTHPGGGVTGLPGHNAAREILREAKRWRGRKIRAPHGPSHAHDA